MDRYFGEGMCLLENTSLGQMGAIGWRIQCIFAIWMDTRMHCSGLPVS